MRARVITSKADPALSDQWVELTRDVLVAASQAQEGYRGYVALYQREEGRAMAVTLWEDERSERASDAASAPSRNAFANAVGAEMSVDVYEVAIADIPTPTPS
jgi:quinol monooxygenase YgiN